MGHHLDSFEIYFPGSVITKRSFDRAHLKDIQYALQAVSSQVATSSNGLGRKPIEGKTPVTFSQRALINKINQS